VHFAILIYRLSALWRYPAGRCLCLISLSLGRHGSVLGPPTLSWRLIFFLQRVRSPNFSSTTLLISPIE
jgi:hypothetical protein